MRPKPNYFYGVELGSLFGGSSSFTGLRPRTLAGETGWTIPGDCGPDELFHHRPLESLGPGGRPSFEFTSLRILATLSMIYSCPALASLPWEGASSLNELATSWRKHHTAPSLHSLHGTLRMFVPKRLSAYVCVTQIQLYSTG